ncbi:hypothetical protein [Planobispora longispora]|uniref:Uncharacterized protein n=1 Tax=Planobispora longispora TaxID=28887 RepID=A0A8J3RLB0_9ACTN|nr:hypothetical protein [Planobispora longispora]BFE80261.1 hypothetical protein GCM10020093_028620 [Planobispora longispora]GIH77063.1 hypothetical protein Plo01_34920 [Planobispora longispora]
MSKAVQFLGLYLVAAGISGTVDHLAVQPFLGPFLNAFNRFVIPNVDFLTGYEIFANLTLSVLGAILVIAAGRTRAS